MEVRSATPTDADAIATVARASLSDSYGQFIDEETIVEIVDTWYDTDRLTELLDDENEHFMLACEDDEVVGFVQGALLGEDPPTGDIDWLHVAPQFRGQHIAEQLLGHFQDTVEDLGAQQLRGKVLAQNEDGAAFYDEHGFERADARSISFADQTFEELIYQKTVGDISPTAVTETIRGPDSQELVVDFTDIQRGAKGPFYTVFTGPERTEKYGFRCGNCESIDTAMDAMGRIECNDCGNKRKATRWDAAYL
ncbi:MAG: GNAT family N-acetyltransferase [Halorientalis sp.]